MTRSNRSCFGALGLGMLACLVAGCEKSGPPPSPVEEAETHQLDGLSTEQRRVFLKGFPGDWRAETAMARGEAEPPSALPLPEDARIIDLPAPDAGEMPVGEAIARRRSRRAFTDAPLALGHLSFLLASTQGITGRKDGLEFRAAPSGGGRYPLETFLAVRRVEGLAPGLYRYLPSGHRLVLVREDAEIGADLQRACYGDASVGAAAVTFVWAAVPERSEWKYGCIAHKMIAIEAGHVCQNLYLASETLGTGTCAMLGYHQPALDALIGADGNGLFAIYLAVVGMPETE